MVTKIVHENHGHPWTEEKGWDGMSIDADTEEELLSTIKECEKEFWCIWISGHRNDEVKGPVPSAFMYKPTGCNSEWTEEQKNHGLPYTKE